MRPRRVLALLVSLLLLLAGCKAPGIDLGGINSDQQHGGTRARVPVVGGDGQASVPERDWSAGPEPLW